MDTKKDKINNMSLQIWINHIYKYNGKQHISLYIS